LESDPTHWVDPDGTTAAHAAAVGAGIAAVVAGIAVNLPLPGGGGVQAITVTGTPITIVGYNYYSKDSHARYIIDEHEAVHSRQNAWRSVSNRVEAENEAYRRQYDLATSMLDNWWQSTKLPVGSKAWNDVLSLKESAERHLRKHDKTWKP